MPHLIQLSYVRSKSWIPAPHRLDRNRDPARSPNYDKAQLSLLQQETSQQALPAAGSRLMAETVARLSAYVRITLPNFLCAILSWVTAEFLAGCAAYAQAMHPTLAIVEERVVPGDPTPTAASQSRNTFPGARSGLSLISGKARQSVENAEPFLPLEHRWSRPGAPSRAEYQPRTQQTRNPSRWYPSISAAVVVILSKLRELRARRRTVIELRNLDDRTLRDIGIYRYDIESIVRRETWWE